MLIVPDCQYRRVSSILTNKTFSGDLAWSGGQAHSCLVNSSQLGVEGCLTTHPTSGREGGRKSRDDWVSYVEWEVGAANTTPEVGGSIELEHWAWTLVESRGSAFT